MSCRGYEMRIDRGQCTCTDHVPGIVHLQEGKPFPRSCTPRFTPVDQPVVVSQRCELILTIPWQRKRPCFVAHPVAHKVSIACVDENRNPRLEERRYSVPCGWACVHRHRARVSILCANAARRVLSAHPVGTSRSVLHAYVLLCFHPIGREGLVYLHVARRPRGRVRRHTESITGGLQPFVPTTSPERRRILAHFSVCSTHPTLCRGS